VRRARRHAHDAHALARERLDPPRRLLRREIAVAERRGVALPAAEDVAALREAR